ncbi:MAG: beta-phosphoglucomutase [Spirochaetaceae bacterium]
MARAIDAALFDLDGVIAFTDRYHYQGWKRLSDEQGWAFDETLNHQLRGVSRMPALQVILDHNGVEVSEEEKKELADRKNGYYRELLKDISVEDLYPGALDFVKELRDRGIKTALASGSKNAPVVVERLGLEEYFDAFVTGHDLTRSKPDPQIFELCAERLEVARERCVVFEDAESGIEAGLAAGMYCVGVGEAARLPSAEQAFTDYAEIDVDALVETGRIER